MGDYEKIYTVALAGNPNVGKSTVFNCFTGMRQHTGNWPGKTVENATGEYVYNNSLYRIQDLPGTYSLIPNSAEEEVTCDYIENGEYDALVIILDASCLQRNIRFALQVLEHTPKAVVCVNLIDEAKKKGIKVDYEMLSKYLGLPVVPTAARSNLGMKELKEQIENLVKSQTNEGARQFLTAENLEEMAGKIYSDCCLSDKDKSDRLDRKLDKFFISRRTGIPVMLIIIAFIFWLTIVGANYPSAALSRIFSDLGVLFNQLLIDIGVPSIIVSAVVDGVYTTLTWIIAVMLPPMAIFFPLFTLLEDSGYLPRVAFNLDSGFKKANTHGKQSLTMAMGFGCNACGVTGCRIIDSPRERMIAIATNSLVPCNGRFPSLIAIISMFFVSAAGGFAATLMQTSIMLFLIVLSVFMTLCCSKFLSCTFLKGEQSSFVLELPPYRKPQIGKVIVRSIFDRTLFVLLRAVIVAAPAGLIIWLLANIYIGDVSILQHMTVFLNPLGELLGLDGAILLAFILGFPANEIVLPIILMIYMSNSSLTELPDLIAFKEILIANNWTVTTAICTLVFILFHFPCSTTCITVFKETKSMKWTVLSFLLPLTVGVTMCMLINGVSHIFEFFIYQ